eukprot:896543-Alexandrium_andersonii.AAC.1
MDAMDSASTVSSQTGSARVTPESRSSCCRSWAQLFRRLVHFNCGSCLCASCSPLSSESCQLLSAFAVPCFA